ncbi:hypothetical protein R1sor_014370 [Riccia sorocarpa]|uniref:Alpha-type protein kinase domain-containing protein n=1 Tax=Riccia sorocarpa TaxID=122646 RepID=A0ABD3HDG7_9MARC
MSESNPVMKSPSNKRRTPPIEGENPATERVSGGLPVEILEATSPVYGCRMTSSETRQDREIKRLRKQLCYLTQERMAFSRARATGIKDSIGKAQELDLAFLLDATNSMAKSFEMVKFKISNMAEGISVAYPTCKLRFALAVYRDYNSPKVPGTDGSDFTSDYNGPNSTFSRAFARIQLQWGEDTAEDVFTGLEKAAGLNWQASNRILVHIGDAACHGSQFHHEAIDDHYPGGDKYGRNIETIIRRLQNDCRITRYYFCHLSRWTHKMIQEFKRAAASDGWLEEWNIGDLHEVPRKVIAACQESISISISVALPEKSMHRIYVKEEVDAKIPNWNSVKIQKGVEYVHRPSSSLAELLETIKGAYPLELLTSAKSDLQVQISWSSFNGGGSIRYPHYALVRGRNPGHPGRVEVVKRFRTELGKSQKSQHTKERYVQQMEVQTVARQLAKEFTKRISQLYPFWPDKVKFTKITLLETEGKFYTKEKLLQGPWTRYSNNVQYVNRTNSGETLQAFSHWTYHVTNGMLLVTDLQGVKLPDEKVPGQYVFWLTDPAIHSNDANILRFTNTNFGEDGCKLFLQNHQCNYACRLLELPSGSACQTQLRVQDGSIDTHAVHTRSTETLASPRPQVYRNNRDSIIGTLTQDIETRSRTPQHPPSIVDNNSIAVKTLREKTVTIKIESSKGVDA